MVLGVWSSITIHLVKYTYSQIVFVATGYLRVTSWKSYPAHGKFSEALKYGSQIFLC